MALGKVWAEDQVYLISAMPQWDMPYHQGPYPTIIYTLDEANGQLDSLWSLDKDRYAWDVDIYPESGNILIVEGWNNAYLFYDSVIGSPTQISLKKLNQVSECCLCVNEETAKHVVFRYSYISDNAESSNDYLELTAYELQSGRFTTGFSSSENNCEVIITGPTPPLASGQDNVIRAYQQNNNIHVESPLPKSIYTLPEELIESKASTVVYNNKDIIVFRDIAQNSERESRTILIHNKKSGSWKRLEIAGSRTTIRPINGWLVGEVAHYGPGTDFDKRITGYPVLSDSVVFIDIQTGRDFTIQMGDSCEILWIDDENNIYYHLTDRLFKGRIAGENTVDRKLILQDPRVRRIHWGLGVSDFPIAREASAP